MRNGKSTELLKLCFVFATIDTNSQTKKVIPTILLTKEKIPYFLGKIIPGSIAGSLLGK